MIWFEIFYGSLGGPGLGDEVMLLLLLPKSHLEEFTPRLIVLTHLADLKPLAFSFRVMV